MTPAEALAAVTINAAHALGLGDEVGSIEPGKQADLAIWRVPTPRQIPYWPAADLVRTVIKRGRSSSSARSRRGRPSGRDGQALPRDSRRTVVVSAGSPEIVIVEPGLGRRLAPPISWKKLRQRLGAVRLVLADRHRDHDPRIELGDQLRRAGRATARRRPGTQAMSTGPMSPSFSSVSRWPMSPRWIVCIPSSSTTNAVWRPRSAPRASSR